VIQEIQKRTFINYNYKKSVFSTFSGSSKQGFVITDTSYIRRRFSVSPHKQCCPTLGILPRRGFEGTIERSMNIGHHLHPFFSPISHLLLTPKK